MRNLTVVSSLLSHCHQRQLDAIIACQCALARIVYTRSGLVSLSEIPIRRSDVTSPFPPSGNEGYIQCLAKVFIHLKEIVHPKMKIHSSFTHPQVVPTLYECLCSAEHKGRYFEESL